MAPQVCCCKPLQLVRCALSGGNICTCADLGAARAQVIPEYVGNTCEVRLCTCAFETWCLLLRCV